MTFTTGLVAGLLIGWIGEWLIDRQFWRRRNAEALRDVETRTQALQTELEEAITEVAALKAERDKVIPKHQAEIKALNDRLKSSKRTLESLQKEYNAARQANQTEIEALKEQLAAADEQRKGIERERDAAVQESQKASKTLKAKIQAIEAQIDTLKAEKDEAVQAGEAQAAALKSQVAAVNAEHDQLKSETERTAQQTQAHLEKLGDTVKAQQTELAAVRAQRDAAIQDAKAKEHALKEFLAAAQTTEMPEPQAEPSASEVALTSEDLPADESVATPKEPREPTPAERLEYPPESDRLESIRGIGPVFARRFNQAGVRTFAELAALDPDRIRTIAGIRNRKSVDPDYWIAEAERLANAGIRGEDQP